MGRKNLLDGLMPPPPGRDSDAPAPPDPLPRQARGAIGAVGRSIADLKARALVEIDPFQIDAGGMQDRLETDDAEDAALAESIREYGQQVPVLVRPHPTEDGRYQIVYGRRRVLALRDLGQPVKALVRAMDDRELVLAQGQENTARRDLSFIEKANFARQLADAGYERKIICDALSIDKTVISRMLSVTDHIPPEMIQAIGAAPSVGRDRWLTLAQRVVDSGDDTDTLISMASVLGGETSDSRFEALFDYLSGNRKRHRAAARARETLPLSTASGVNLGLVSRSSEQTILQINNAMADGFADWLVARITDLHRTWREEEHPMNPQKEAQADETKKPSRT